MLKKLEIIFKNAPVGIAICNAQTHRLEMINPAFAQIHGYEPHEVIGNPPASMFAPNCILRSHNHDKTHCSGPRCVLEETTFEAVHVKKDLSPLNVEAHISFIKDDDGEVLYRIINLFDITQRKQYENNLRQTQAKLSAVISSIPDLLWLKDANGVFMMCNPSFEKFFGVKREEVIGKTNYDFLSREQADLFCQRDQEAIEANEMCINEEEITLASNGRYAILEIRKIPIYNEDTFLGVFGIGRDITQRKKDEEKIYNMMHRDTLTGLANRMLAKNRTEQIIATAKRDKVKNAFLFLDLDDFKRINDSLGHPIGDNILKAVASRLKESIRESDVISRQGGDEFLIILPNVKSEDEITIVAKKILAELEKPFDVNTHTLNISGSIGISIFPEDGTSFESLLQSADTAMYKAKEMGRNNYCFYTQQMKHNIIGQFKLQNDLKKALHNKEFVLYYQPQIDLSTGTIIGAEALIRWVHPKLGMIPPMQFIPIAESSGLIVEIGQWVIEEACRQAAHWHQNGMKISVAINISAVQFKRGDLLTTISDALVQSQLDPTYLELELTESIMMHDVETTLQTVKSLKTLGLLLSIDDFGTGYSSLAYLKRFAVDKLKIDQSFVRGVLQDREDAVIIKAIVQMASSLNFKTIAEGVEDVNVLEIIKSYGCDEVQGYYFAKPMEALDFEKFYLKFPF
jgi:diguanylate cyclase (GGDEF)-like protein/PAS domain S-box-containing protein